jgi:DNA invertase Pin-like site-specific DNA recombinase
MRKPAPTPASGVPTFGYVSVPGDVRPDEVATLRVTLDGACRRLNLRLVDVVSDSDSEAPDGDARPGLLQALDRIEAGEAACLIVNDLEDLSRRVGTFANVIDRLERQGTRLVALNVGLDTATESGRLATARRDGAVLPQPAEPPAPEVEPPAPEPEAPPLEPLPEVRIEPEAPPEPRPEPVRAPEPEILPAPPPTQQPPERPAPGKAARAYGYASVPADADDTADLDAQKEAIERSCRTLGVELVEVVSEREPRTGKALDRGGLSFLIERIAAGGASCIVVSGLERLSRSVAELGTIVRWLERNDVRLVAMDLELDTARPGGRTTLRALASVAGWEHERLSDRTRKGLEAAREKRRAASGSSTPDWAAIRNRIATMRADGMTLQAIADVLNEEGVPTQRGGAKWRKSSVQTAAGYRRRSRPKSVGDLPDVQKSPATEPE